MALFWCIWRSGCYIDSILSFIFSVVNFKALLNHFINPLVLIKRSSLWFLIPQSSRFFLSLSGFLLILKNSIFHSMKFYVFLCIWFSINFNLNIFYVNRNCSTIDFMTVDWVNFDHFYFLKPTKIFLIVFGKYGL